MWTDECKTLPALYRRADSELRERFGGDFKGKKSPDFGIGNPRAGLVIISSDPAENPDVSDVGDPGSLCSVDPFGLNSSATDGLQPTNMGRFAEALSGEKGKRAAAWLAQNAFITQASKLSLTNLPPTARQLRMKETSLIFKREIELLQPKRLLVLGKNALGGIQRLDEGFLGGITYRALVARPPKQTPLTAGSFEGKPLTKVTVHPAAREARPYRTWGQFGNTASPPSAKRDSGR